MKKSTIFVKIQGGQGKGKTLIAAKLARIFKKIGIDSEVWESDGSWVNDITDKSLNLTLKSLGTKVKVIVQTEQVNRHSIL